MLEMRSDCPVAYVMNMVGDRWSLVIVRDMLSGKSRFSEFLASAEEITTSVLADRLTRLEQEGLVEKAPYQTRPARFDYKLTPKGRGLLPVLQQMAFWAERYVDGTGPLPVEMMSKRLAPSRPVQLGKG